MLMPDVMNTRTIVLLSVSAGAGHVRAAEALKQTAEASYPSLRTIHLDVMDIVPDHFRTLYAESYMKIIKHHPSLWGYLYRMTEKQKGDSALNQARRAIERLNTGRLAKLLKEMRPDHVICTHFLPASLLSRMIKKGQFEKPVWVVDTDFDVHKMWIYERMSGYFAADAEVAWRMADHCVPPERIHVTGIPIMPAFSRQYDRQECAREIGIDPRKPTLLMMAGAAGLGEADTLTERLLRLPLSFQIVAIAGKNAELLDSLRTLAAQYPGRLFPMGFTTTIERVMAVADVAVTKPGGLTTSECLAMRLPMILISPIPGQEERNADYLLEHGAALKAYDLAGLEYRVKWLFDQMSRLEAMRQQIERIRKPNAALDVLRVALGSEEAA